MSFRNPSIRTLLIATFLSGRNSYSFRKIIAREEFKRFKEQSVRNEFSKLNNRQIIVKSGEEWKINKSVRARFAHELALSYIPSPFIKEAPRNTIVSFDISSTQIRNWLRNQLKIFNYKMLQQSLWRGPGPLPKVFLRKLEDLNIRKDVKIFTIK